MKLRTLIFRTRAELEKNKLEWLELLEHAAIGTIFQSPDWAMGWWEMVQPTSQPLCIALYDGEQLVGLAPLCIVKKWGIRAIQFMGGAANDENQFIVRGGYENAFGEQIGNALDERRAEWDAIQFTPTSVNDPLLGGLRERLSQKYWSVALRPTALPYFDLPPTWDEYWGGLSQKRRHTWNYSRRLLGRNGDISFRVITDADGLGDGIAELVLMHARNWQRRKQYNRLAGLNRMPEFQPTLVKVCRALAAREQAWLGQFCFKQKPIGWMLSLRHNDTVCDFMTAYDSSYAVYSPGVWVSLEMTREAIRQQIRHYQVGRGGQAHKFWMGAKPAYAQGLHVAQKSARGLLFSMYHASHDYAASVLDGLRKTHTP